MDSDEVLYYNTVTEEELWQQKKVKQKVIKQEVDVVRLMVEVVGAAKVEQVAAAVESDD